MDQSSPCLLWAHRLYQCIKPEKRLVSGKKTLAPALLTRHSFLHRACTFIALLTALGTLWMQQTPASFPGAYFSTACIYSCNKYLLSSYFTLGTLLGPGHRKINKTWYMLPVRSQSNKAVFLYTFYISFPLIFLFLFCFVSLRHLFFFLTFFFSVLKFELLSRLHDVFPLSSPFLQNPTSFEILKTLVFFWTYWIRFPSILPASLPILPSSLPFSLLPSLPHWLPLGIKFGVILPM